MSKIVLMISFELNNENLLADWQQMSTMISGSLQGVDGFIYRDSARGEDGKVYCILKWDSKEQQQAFRKNLEAGEDWPQMMAEFSRIVNFETMKEETLEVL